MSEVVVWTFPTPEADDPLHAKLYALLEPEERQRAGRLRRESDARDFTAAHALLHAVLRGVLDAPYRLAKTESGKPYVPGTSIEFNLTHTRGLSAVALSRTGAVGIDAERLEPHRDDRALVAQQFDREERAWIEAATDGQQTERFFRIWTLKEAYAKALGVGLSLDLADSSFAIDGSAIRLRASAPMDPAPGRWSFEQWWPSETHLAAVAWNDNDSVEHRSGIELFVS